MSFPFSFCRYVDLKLVIFLALIFLFLPIDTSFLCVAAAGGAGARLLSSFDSTNRVHR